MESLASCLRRTRIHKVLAGVLNIQASSLNHKRIITRLLGKTDIKVVVDVGCGKGIVSGILKRSINAYFIGLDVFIPYLYEVKKKNIYEELLVTDARYPPFRSIKDSVTVMTELIEHLEKEIALKTIKE